MADSHARRTDSWRSPNEHLHNSRRIDSWRPDTNQNQEIRVVEDSNRTQNIQGYASRSSVQDRHNSRPHVNASHFPATEWVNPNLHLNPNALSFQPALGNSTGPTNAGSHFTKYQPLRFSNGTQELAVMRNGTESWSALTQQSQFGFDGGFNSWSQHPGFFPTNQLQSFNHAIPSIESGTFHPSGVNLGTQGNTPAASSYSNPTPRRTVSPPPAPSATDLYLAQARLPSVVRSAPQKLLVVLDLNGTLVVKPRHNPTKFKVRAGVPKLIQYLFQNHVVMIYTSSRPRNADIVINGLFGKEGRKNLAAVWARDKLELSPEQFYEKVQVYKKLDRLWADKSIQAKHPTASQGGRWDQSNTVLVDDSHLKALAQPHNLLQVPEFKANAVRKTKALKKLAKKQGILNEEQIMQKLQLKLEELKYQSDVSRLILKWQTGKADEPRIPGESVTAQTRQEIQLQSPTSPISENSEDASEDSEDDIVQRALSRQMATIGAEETQQPEKERDVSPIPDGVWSAILEGNQFKGLEWMPKDNDRSV